MMLADISSSFGLVWSLFAFVLFLPIGAMICAIVGERGVPFVRRDHIRVGSAAFTFAIGERGYWMVVNREYFHNIRTGDFWPFVFAAAMSLGTTCGYWLWAHRKHIPDD